MMKIATIEKSIEFGSAEVSETVNLYPEFVQARWLKFNVGESGNGAVYVLKVYAAAIIMIILLKN